jgi:hypothetical protein
MPQPVMLRSAFCSYLLTDLPPHTRGWRSTQVAVTPRERLRFPVLDLMSYPDPDLVALWIFALLGKSEEDLLLEYLDLWPSDYRAVAQA